MVNLAVKYFQENDNISDGANLLISILVRYPEIGTINFDKEKNLLKLTFMFSDQTAKIDFALVRRLLLDSIFAYHVLENVKVNTADIQLNTYGNMTMLNIIRDVATLSNSEIALIITLLRDKYQDRLIIDYNDSMLEEDLAIQEEVIGNMLESVKRQYSGSSLIGIREEGRVLVFNK